MPGKIKSACLCSRTIGLHSRKRKKAQSKISRKRALARRVMKKIFLCLLCVLWALFSQRLEYRIDK